MLDMSPGRNNREVFLNVRNLDRATQKGIRRGFYNLGDHLSSELSKEMLSKNKTGRVYFRRNRGGGRRRHTASAAGQTAANRRGTMRKARGYQIRGSDQMEFGIRSGRGADYAEFLENGTRNMEARPSVGNAVQATQRDAFTGFSDAIESSIEELG